MGRTKRAFWAIGLLAAVTVAGLAALIWHPTIAPTAARTAFSPDQIARGATLAAIGDCAVCHTTAHGADFAGGRPLSTPFGTVFVANITPDPATGIGAWSERAFLRAMRDGVDREGHQLYPALPYPHFTRASDADIAALYAFLMTRPAVHAPTPRNRLPFPLNIRAVVAGWNLLFLKPGPWQPEPGHDGEWNRGAYLVEAVGHCGACHTPHNALGAEQAGRLYDGGEAEGWYAPALASAGRPWTVDELAGYLRTGVSARHGVAAGPMRAVVQELAGVPDAEVHAIATYMAPRLTPALPAAPPEQAANAVFTGACGGCHAADAPMTRAGAPPLAVTAAINAPTPKNAIRIILQGIPWRDGHAGPYMPAFAASLSDPQLAEIVTYLRASYTTRPAWTDVPGEVQRARQEGTSEP